MRIINIQLLNDFCNEHPNARSPLTHWRNVTESAAWHNLANVRESFRHADWVKEKGKVIFNIAGNRFRLAAKVDYQGQLVVVTNVMTHAEYSENRW